jgi:hypothetical protein
MTRVGLSSYHRMKQRAEIAEAACEEWARDYGVIDAFLQRQRERADGNWALVVHLGKQLGGELDAEGRMVVPACRELPQPTWRHDFGTVVGGVLLAAGLIAAIVWGIYG